MTLHGAGAVQGMFCTTVQMGVLFPSPNVSSYTLQSSGKLQVVQGAQAMGAKNSTSVCLLMTPRFIRV